MYHEKSGLPAEEVDAIWKATLNDWVGTSHLESSNEEVLQCSVKEVHLDKHGNMESVENVEEGSKETTSN